ncbi:MAG TPA: hypothetical protein VHP35_20350, partial [Terriglobia bacterium]|nr:hypothetical protein [Terriglobia bacterium]
MKWVHDGSDRRNKPPRSAGSASTGGKCLEDFAGSAGQHSLCQLRAQFRGLFRWSTGLISEELLSVCTGNHAQHFKPGSLYPGMTGNGDLAPTTQAPEKGPFCRHGR